MKMTAFLASLLLLGSVGCAPDEPPAERTATPTPPPADTAPGETPQNAPGSSATTPAPAPSTPPPSTPQSSSEIPATEGQGMATADQELASRVRDALQQDLSLAPAVQNIQVSAQNGEVTLSGSVGSEQEKENIGAQAQQVEGVTRVNNLLEVMSASVKE
jgi:hypothetical protein